MNTHFEIVRVAVRPGVEGRVPAELATSYGRWFSAKVQASLDDPRPAIPHDEAMAQVEQMLEEKRKARRAQTRLSIRPAPTRGQSPRIVIM